MNHPDDEKLLALFTEMLKERLSLREQVASLQEELADCRRKLSAAQAPPSTLPAPGELLKRWRVSRHMSQREVARAVRVNQAAVSKWEGGGRAPMVHIAARIEEVTAGAVPMRAWGPL